MDSNQELQFGHRSSGERSRNKTGSRNNLKKKLEYGTTAGDGMDCRQSPPRKSQPPPPAPPLLPRSSLSSSSDVLEGDKEEDQSRPQKRTRLVWTLELHTKFVDAVEFLGEYDAVPKNILREMGVDGITRENIASHLQKYRLYKKEMQVNSDGDSSNPGSGAMLSAGGIQGGMSFVQLLKDIQGDRSFVQLLNDIQGGRSFILSPLSPPPPGFGPPPCASAPAPPNHVEYMKQELQTMKSKLEKEGNSLSPETSENLEKEIRSFTEKYSSIFGSSSFK